MRYGFPRRRPLSLVGTECQNKPLGLVNTIQNYCAALNYILSQFPCCKMSHYILRVDAMIVTLVLSMIHTQKNRLCPGPVLPWAGVQQWVV